MSEARMNDAAERLRLLRQLFDAVVDLPADERGAKLAALALDVSKSLPGTDLDRQNYAFSLQIEVEAIIMVSEQTSSHLAWPLGASINAPDDSASLIGQRLGPYHITRLVGMGGMGAVFEASRADDQFQKRVAIKLVQRGLDSDVMLARFRRERQILANLVHANIATLLDGGVTADGRPYLVMEFIDGETITSWCNRNKLSVADRIALFQQVCAAVQFAHKNLVVHRDIKPGNILVSSDGSVKLLDFGIAKLITDDALGESVAITRGAARAFTAEYASPEQIRGDTLTTASDIYSLGVVLFELLAGRRPHVFESHALIDIERTVLEATIPRPSAVISQDAAVLSAEQSVERLRRRLTGDLDNITLMALQMEPARRYPSVEAFDGDMRRHLAGLPVVAERDRFGYRAGKFVRRNMIAVGAASLVLISIIGGAISTAVQAQRARVEEQKQAQINEFLRTLLSSVQPETGRRDVQVSEVLDSAAKRLEHDLGTQPAVRGDLETVIGQSYLGLGRYDEAERHLRRALALRREVNASNSEPVVSSLSALGQLFDAQGALDSAESKFKEALTLRAKSRHAPEELDASLNRNLGNLAHNRGQPAEAEKNHRKAMEIMQALYGPRDDRVASALNDLSVAIGEQGRLAEAETLQRQSLGILQTNHPEGNAMVAGALNGLAGVLDFQGKIAPAESAYIATLEMRKRVLGAEHPDYTFTLFNYSIFVYDRQRYAEAAKYAREILALRGKTLPESHPSVAAALQTLGRSLDRVGDTKGGEQALMESLELRRKYNGDSSWTVASSTGVLGDHYVLLKQYPTAEATLLRAQALFVKALGEGNQRTQVNTKRLIALYEAWGKPEKAAEYKNKLPKEKS